MDFFARQETARGTSAKLVALFTLAVVAIIAAVDLVVFIVATQRVGRRHDRLDRRRDQW